MNLSSLRLPNRRALRAALAPLPALALVAFLAGCGKDSDRSYNLMAASTPPPAVDASIRVVPLDANSFQVRVRYAPLSTGGKLRSQYRLEPSLEGSNGWTALTDGQAALTLPRGKTGRWTMALRVLDDSGAEVASGRYEFTESNVLPLVSIRTPRPNPQQPISTLTSVFVEWTGNDPDGIATQRPVGYASRVVRALDIDPASPGGVSLSQLNAFFSADRASNPDAWATYGADDTTTTIGPFEPGVVYYFAVVARDEAGGETATYLLDSNVLWFRPTNDILGPSITLSSPLFHRTDTTPGIDLAPMLTISVRSADTFTFNWSAVPTVGFILTGYRWAVDIEDITDETPRLDPDDVSHWSAWSLDETSATVGPFASGSHLVYVQARDNLGAVSMVGLQIDVYEHVPGADILIVDDLYGTPTQLAAGQPPGGNIQLVGPWPMEAEQDSFHVAVGGFPDEFRIRSGTPGAISAPGVFAGYEADTLDYAFWPYDGTPAPFKYRAVVWYTDNASAARTGSKFGSALPATAIRTINSVNRVNTLAQYVQQGGKLWIFGEGMTPAITNGYRTRYSSNSAPIPYTAGENPRLDMLSPGNFLYDFCHLRSELNVTGTANTSLTTGSQMQSAIPYLPEFRGPASQSDRSHDPRIGPGAERTALLWSGLPRLTLGAYRGLAADPAQRSQALRWVITQPLSILEGGEPVLDTLYLNQGRTYDPNRVLIPASDGFPNAVHYHGSEHGEVVWFGFPLHYFEPEQARAVVEVTMRVFGIEPQAIRTGVGTAHTTPVASGDPGDGGTPVRRR